MRKEYRIGKLYRSASDPSMVYCICSIKEKNWRGHPDTEYEFFYLDRPDFMYTVYKSVTLSFGIHEVDDRWMQ